VSVTEQAATTEVGQPRWLTVSAGSDRVRVDPPLRSRRVYAQVIAMAALVVLAVGILGAVASRQVAEREAVNDAAQRADVLAEAVVQPALRDGILTQQPAAAALLDAAMREHILGDDIVRVKFWTSEGTIVYSDEKRLVGQVFPLSEDEKSVLANPTIRAQVTDLKEPENRFERGRGKLLEVYRPVWTPNGETLLFETYAPYSTVNQRTGELWRGFASITFSSLLVLILLMLPVLWRLLDRLRRSQAQRETLLERAVEASAEERRRIAATLHDGVVQELVAASFVVSGAAARAESEGQDRLAESLRGAAGTVRTGIGGLRSLLVDIYPPSLDGTGLVAALGDLVASLRTRDIEVQLDVSGGDPTGLDTEAERLVFRVAQECLRNAARHSDADRVDVTLAAEGDVMVLDVVDNGIGFDPATHIAQPAEGHFGLRLMSDTATQADGELRVASAPGLGTHWQLRVPRA
jgi:signal transduction histidine kinase